MGQFRLLLTVSLLHAFLFVSLTARKYLLSTVKSGNESATCPDGLPLVTCLVAPCSTVPCPDGFTCVDDYCGGCNIRCLQNVATKPPKVEPSLSPLAYNMSAAEAKPGVCPDEVVCMEAPCATIRCKSGYTCIDLFCGGCAAVCVPDFDVEKELAPRCRPRPDMECPTNPCDGLVCQPGYECVANDCGSCSAKCLPVVGTSGSP